MNAKPPADPPMNPPPASLQGSRVLVTGAGGFIGSHLAERLVREGARVRALVHYNALGLRGWLDHSDLAGELEIVAGDIADADSVAAAVAGCDFVFHLAALIGIPYSYVAPRNYVRTNVEGTLNVLQAARSHAVRRTLVTSTSEVYGTAREVPIPETHPLQGQSPYSASKIGADKMAESFFLSFGLPVVTVRPFNTYGPRQSLRAVIPTIISQALEEREVKLGNLHPTRDLNFVEDTVAGFLAAALAPDAVGQVINLGTGKEITVGDLARRIFGLLGRETPPQLVAEASRLRPVASEVERLCADATRARQILGWQPAVSLDEGLRRTIDWLGANRHRYARRDYVV
jgi:NAD dependent epimerase/dehydratase